MSNFSDQLVDVGACGPAVEWAAGLGDVDAAEAWRLCQHGEWLLWWLQKTSPQTDLREIGYWCAERARQSAIQALGSKKGATLAACAPIVDQTTARAAGEAAAEAAAGAARAAAGAARAGEAAARAAWAAEGAAAGAAAWAAGAARAAGAAARAAWAAAEAAAWAAWGAAARAVEEQRAIAIEVRRRFSVTGEVLGP